MGRDHWIQFGLFVCALTAGIYAVVTQVDDIKSDLRVFQTQVTDQFSAVNTRVDGLARWLGKVDGGNGKQESAR